MTLLTVTICYPIISSGACHSSVPRAQLLEGERYLSFLTANSRLLKPPSVAVGGVSW